MAFSRLIRLSHLHFVYYCGTNMTIIISFEGLGLAEEPELYSFLLSLFEHYGVDMQSCFWFYS